MPKQKRSAVSKKTGKPVLIWFPQDAVSEIDQLCQSLDTDRSKFIRAAVREKAANLKKASSR